MNAKTKHNIFISIKKALHIDGITNMLVDYVAAKKGWRYAEQLESKLHAPVVYLYKKWMEI